MDTEILTFKFFEHGRGESVIPLTMEQAVDIARNRAVLHRSTVTLSVKLKSGRFSPLGEYTYDPQRDNERLVRVYPKIPKSRAL